ncbi:MAG TPA: PHP domain-containing protein [Acidobacteriota bacterium]|nr:PHP domain-containing protein [Acidobacteriota bacterium]
MAKIRKKVTLLFISLVILYLAWLSVQLISFKDYNEFKEPSTSLEITGVYHIHSTFSDGKKTVEKIAESAAKSSLDFCILTDHGSPNYESLKSQGWKQGVLVLAGSELSVSRGHLVALNFGWPQKKFSQNAESAAYEITKLNGFSVIAHPYSKTHWTWGRYAGYSGMEIINADAMVKRNYMRMLPYLPALLIEPKLPMLKMINTPEKNLSKWDRLNKNFTTYGYYSTDAHMFYTPLFSLLQIHVILKKDLSSDFEKAKTQVFRSLQSGRFYNSIDAAAPAAGFRFWGEKGNNKIYMGESSVFDESISLFIKTPDSISCQTALLHNGKPVLTDSKDLISYTCLEPGVYRAEVYLHEKSPLDKSCPWILSNPIFLREEANGQNK